MRNTRYIVPAEGALTVFTDGACLLSPRRGGTGVRFVHSDKLGNETVFDLDEPGYAGATNNQMELPISGSPPPPAPRTAQPRARSGRVVVAIRIRTPESNFARAVS